MPTTLPTRQRDVLAAAYHGDVNALRSAKQQITALRKKRMLDEDGRITPVGIDEYHSWTTPEAWDNLDEECSHILKLLNARPARSTSIRGHYSAREYWGVLSADRATVYVTRVNSPEPPRAFDITTMRRGLVAALVPDVDPFTLGRCRP